MSTSDRAANDDLTRLLASVGLRRRARLALACASWSAALAGALALIGVGTGAVLLVAALIAVALALWVLFGRNDVEAAARRTDDQLGTELLLTTGSEVSRSWTLHAGPVTRALLSRAGDRAAHADPRLLVPLASRGAVAGLAVAAGSWALLAADVGRWPGRTGAPMEPEAPAETAETGASASIQQIGELAALIGADATMEDNDLLDRSAAGLRDVARQAGRGELAQQDIDAAVSELLRQARGVYDGRPPEWMPDAGEQSAAIGERLAAYRAAQAAIAEAAAAEQGAGAAGPGEPGGLAGAAGRALESPGGEGPAQSAGGSLPGGPEEGGAPGGDGFQSAGASTEAGIGAGDQAGLGTQPLGEEVAEAPLDLSPAEDMELRAEDLTSGAMLKLEVAAEPGEGAAEPGEGGPLPGQGAEATATAAVPRERVRPSDRAAVAHYFTPENAALAAGRTE